MLCEGEDEEEEVEAGSDPAVHGILLVLLLHIAVGVVILLPVSQRNVFKQCRASDVKEQTEQTLQKNIPFLKQRYNI